MPIQTLSYGSMGVFRLISMPPVGTSATWTNENYKTIKITGGTDATNTTLISWLYANATLVI
jgi:hypothetical protein